MLKHLFSTFPILALFLVGYGLKRFQFFKEGTIDDIKQFVTNIALPALLFNSFLTLSIEAKYVYLVVVIFLLCLGMLLLGKGVRKLLHIKSSYFAFMMSGFEMGMFGYAMFISLYGNDEVGKIAFMDIGQVLFVFTILMTLLLQLRDGKQSSRIVWRRIVLSPIILAMASGILIGQLKGRLPSNEVFNAIGSFITLVGSVTVPLIAITIGYGLDISRKGIGLPMLTIALRKVLLMLCALIINRFLIQGWLGMGPMYGNALFIMLLTPPPFVISVFARNDNKQDVRYINQTLSLDCLISTVLSILAAAIGA
jgi:predicted permease